MSRMRVHTRKKEKNAKISDNFNVFFMITSFN